MNRLAKLQKFSSSQGIVKVRVRAVSSDIQQGFVLSSLVRSGVPFIAWGPICTSRHSGHYMRRSRRYHLQKSGKCYSTQLRRLTVVKVRIMHFLEQHYVTVLHKFGCFKHCFGVQIGSSSLLRNISVCGENYMIQV